MTEQTTVSEHSLNELEQFYTDAESVDSDIFAEMRSNVLLINGEHYNRRQSLFYRRVRDSKELNEQQKLRLTKNHTQKITKTYCNNIISLAPGVSFMPKNETELHDQKVAEMHESVWQDAKERYNLDDKIDDWCDDFVGVGEVATQILWDPTLGKLKGHYQAMGEDGQPLFDEMGQPVRGEPVHEGGFVFKDIFAPNLLRAPEAKDIRKSEYLILREMVSKDQLKRQFPDQAEKIQGTQDRTQVVFDAQKGGYRRTQNECMLKQIYFRPCMRYPNGYFYFWVDNLLLTKGELPGGIFPIVVQQFDRIQTSPRGRSPVKTIRPYQAEINRAASKIAEHQITLGDDKVLIQNGTKISSGIALPGVRSINYTGIEPKTLPGRDGSQYLAYMQAQIEELYQVMGVAEDSVESPTGQLDPYALLYRSASQRKKFSRYVKRFEKFLKEVALTHNALAKIHLPDDAVIYAVGKKEQINIAEFRAVNDICCEVKVQAQTEDVETKMGKFLSISHALQYVGNKLEKEDIGKLMRCMPYGNFEESFSDLTLEYDTATNVILALDRGENPGLSQYDNHQYMIKRLVSRMRQADFKFLPPEIQQGYQMQMQAHQQAEVDRLAMIQKAEAGFVPTGGYMVVCDLYVSDPANPEKTRRARIPYEALKWLIEKLETQGQSLDELEKMNQGAVSQMAQQLLQRGQGAQANGMAGAPAMS